MEVDLSRATMLDMVAGENMWKAMKCIEKNEYFRLKMVLIMLILVLAFFFGFGISSPSFAFREKKRKILIDTDMASDDWIAICLLLASPDIEVVGLSTHGVGECRYTPAIENGLKLLKFLGREDIPVFKGARVPLKYSNVFPAWLRDLMDSFYRIKLPHVDQRRIESVRSVQDFLRDFELNESEEKITIVALGGLTNLAEYLLTRKNSGSSKIEEVVIMGGSLHAGGNIVQIGKAFYPRAMYSEWNIFVDPIAADIVFKSNLNITLVPLDAVSCCRNDDSFRKQFHSYQLDDNGYLPVGDMESFVAHVMDLSEADFPSLPLWDVVAAYYFLFSSEFTDNSKRGKTEKIAMRIHTVLDFEENHLGETQICEVSDFEGCKEVKVVMEVDRENFEKDFFSLIHRGISKEDPEL